MTEVDIYLKNVDIIYIYMGMCSSTLVLISILYVVYYIYTESNIVDDNIDVKNHRKYHIHLTEYVLLVEVMFIIWVLGRNGIDYGYYIHYVKEGLMYIAGGWSIILISLTHHLSNELKE
jgi:hypothetical protein